ncbi:MAG: 16S rRNA (cytosine(1402)-N(4))-methyltransferase RsmH [Acidimicrobiia bacterium]
MSEPFDSQSPGGREGTPAFQHTPVMLDVIVRVFGPVPPGVVVDMTVGGGGHARAILTAHPHLTILGLDQDRDALAAAASNLSEFGDRVILRHSRFDRLLPVMTDLQVSSVSGVLFDLGVSSPQVDRADRGFSYRSEGALDMRMDTDQQWSARDVVNGYSETQLAWVLRTHGDEKYAARIAKAIVAARPVETTAELATIVRDAIPAPARRRGGHPAKRTFQAIRIEVNRELEILPGAVDDAITATKPGGRVAVLTYHSGEDRIVKSRFRHGVTGGCTCPPALPCVCDAVRTVRLVKAPATPSAEEIAANRRAESARLRVAERIADAG